MPERLAPPESKNKKDNSKDRKGLTENPALDLKTITLSPEVSALKNKLNIGGEEKEIPNLPDSIDYAKTLFTNLNSGKNKKLAAAEISKNAIGSLKLLKPEQIFQKTILAFKTPNGKISFADENDKNSVKRITKNGINSQYLIQNNKENIVICYRNKNAVVYVPYSPKLDTPILRSKGIEYMTQVIEKAKRLVAERKIYSYSVMGKLVTEVVPAEMIANLMIIEHVDPGKFKRASSTDELKSLYNSVFVIAGQNREKSYNYSGSTDGAFGFAQFMPATYKEIQEKYKFANLIFDFKTAMKNHVNAVIAMYCLLDINLRAAPINCRKLYQKNKNLQALYLGSCYNGGVGRTNRKMSTFGEEWRENLPEETRTYLDKLEGLQNPKKFIQKKVITKVGQNLKKAFSDIVGETFKPEPNFKEGLDKRKSTFTFATGLKLALAKDKLSANLWQDPAKTPLEHLSEKFPKKSLKDLKPEIAHYLATRYTNNVPIVKITSADLEKPISKYFRLKELLRVEKVDKIFMEKRGTWKKYAKFMILHTDGEYYWNVARIDQNLVKTLDQIREKAGFPIEVDEGVRPYGYNKDMYMARYGEVIGASPHVSGRAVDLSRTGSPRKDNILLSAIRSVLRGFGGGIGLGSTVYHIDVKIQGGKPLKNGRKTDGNWILDKNGKVVLRTREWPY